MPTTLTQIDTVTTAAGTTRAGLSINHDDTVLFGITNEASKFYDWYDWDGANFTINQEAAKQTTDYSAAISNTGDKVAIFSFTGAFIRVYSIAAGPSAGTLLATSAAISVGTFTQGLAWAPDDSAIAVTGTTSPFIKVVPYDYALDTFGAIASAVGAAAPAASGALTAIAWAPSGNFVAGSIGASFGDVQVFPWSGSALGTVATVSGAKTFTTGIGATGVAWSNAEDLIVVSGDNAPFVAVYAWSGSALGSTALAVPSMVSAGSGVANAAGFDNNDEFIWVAGTSMDETVNAYIYAWSGSAFGARVDADISPGVVVGAQLGYQNTTLYFFNNTSDISAYATGLTSVKTAVLSSTLTQTANEDGVAVGGLELVATLTGTTWHANMGTDVTQTEDFISALVSAQSEALGWNAIIVMGNYRKRVVDDLPAGYWRMGGSYTDLSANGHNGTASGLTTGSALLLSSAQLSSLFDSGTAKMTVTDHADIRNIFDGGGAVEVVINPFSSGYSQDLSRVLYKGAWEIILDNQAGGYVDITLKQNFSTDNGLWKVHGTVPVGYQSHIVVTYDNSAAANDPTIWINGIAHTVANGMLVEETTPSGTRVTDAAFDLVWGSNTSAAVTFNGLMQEAAIYSSVITEAQILDHLYAASYAYGLAFSDVARTSDTVVTVTMPAFPFYDISAQETITGTFPATTNAAAAEIVATPTFTIDPTSRVTGFTPKPGVRTPGPFGNVNGGLGPAAGDAFRILGAGDEYVFGTPALSIGLLPTDLPRIVMLRVTEIGEA